MPDRAGTQLGNYRLLRLLGRGGTAEVYLGEHVYLNWLAALKVLRTKLFDKEAEQFVREAQTLSHLNHPNIVRVLDFAVQDGQPFLVTEYAPHGTLSTRHPRGTPISVAEAATYVQHIASALQYAHEQRIVHRDIKPENMLLGSQQEVLLADFGIAILASATRQEYAQEKERSVAGTTLYMAPEQLQGEPQAASDQYALAVVVYEWLCGRRPFEGTLLEVAMQHLSTAPMSPRRWQPDLSPAVEQVVLRALAKDPGARFPSVRSFADAFLKAADHAGFSAVSVPIAADGQLAAQAEDTVQIATTGESGPHHQAMTPNQAHETSGYAPDEKPRVPLRNEPVTDEKAQILSGSEPATKPLWKVPVILASLIGREREMQDLRDLLMQPEVRLVTLLGPGGMGKTRLSIALATDLRGSFADGICFVALTAVSDAEQMMTAVAHELGLQEQERSYQDALLEFLGDKQMLLLLDNFEQLVQTVQTVQKVQAAALLESLLRACSRVKILVSSRAVLHLPVEHQYRLSSLAVPDVTSLPQSEAIARYAAVVLLVQRARTLLPTFQVTASNAPVLAEICARLDGIPLAIELAAARIKLLPPQALLPRLSNSLQVLTKGLPTLPERQQTLRRTIQWSYDLLDSWEQQVFCLLSVFVGGFTLSALEDLYAALYMRSEDALGSVLDVVESLIDSSLVLPPGQEDEAEEPRLDMLETIREYSRERLIERGEREAARRSHAELFLRIAEEAESELAGVQQALWLERLEREHDNLRAAMEWMLETANGQVQDGINRREMALRLGSALFAFWLARGYLHEGRAFMDRALSGSEAVSLPLQGQAFKVASDLHMRLGDLERGEVLSAQSLECFRALGDGANVAACLRSLGWIAHQKSETERAYALYEEALTLYKELNNRRGIANTLLNMAFLTQTRGDYERARVLLEEVVARQRALGNKIGIFSALYQLAQVLFGLYGAADALRIRALLEEGLDLAREVGNRRGVASMQGMLGWVAYSEGNLAGAAQLVEDCLLFYKDGGDRLVTGHYLCLLGQITTARHDYAGAQALFKEGLAIAQEVGDNKNEIVPNCLEGLAELALLQGYHPWAARLWGAAGRWREMIDAAVMPSQRVIQESQMESAREFLGTQAFDALLQEGRTLSPEEAFVARSALPQSQRKPQVIAGTQRAQRPGLLPNTGKKKIPAYPAGLSARQVDILRLVAQGLSDIEVAERLVISPRTVTTHLTSIYNKLGVNSRVAATRFAVEHHLV